MEFLPRAVREEKKNTCTQEREGINERIEKKKNKIVINCRWYDCTHGKWKKSTDKSLSLIERV